MNQFSAWLPSRRQLQRSPCPSGRYSRRCAPTSPESIARTIGEAVANAVHEIIHRLSPSARIRSRPALPGQSGNRHPGTIRMKPTALMKLLPDQGRYREDDSIPPRGRVFAGRRSIAVGCQTAAWWLGRQVGRRPLWALHDAGRERAVALLSYAAGPIIGVGLLPIAGRSPDTAVATLLFQCDQQTSGPLHGIGQLRRASASAIISSRPGRSGAGGLRRSSSGR